jgi:hypothetical protein
LFEYAFGTSDANPADADTAWTSGVQTFGASDHFAITYQRSIAAEDVELTVEKSADLAGWGTDASLVFVGEVPNGPGTTLVTWRVATPFADDERCFLRIKVTLTP